jgi:hypothetical protein
MGAPSPTVHRLSCVHVGIAFEVMALGALADLSVVLAMVVMVTLGVLAVALGVLVVFGNRGGRGCIEHGGCGGCGHWEKYGELVII